MTDELTTDRSNPFLPLLRFGDKSVTYTSTAIADALETLIADRDDLLVRVEQLVTEADEAYRDGYYTGAMHAGGRAMHPELQGTHADPSAGGR